jgi:hypothetical protein
MSKRKLTIDDLVHEAEQFCALRLKLPNQAAARDRSERAIISNKHDSNHV